MVLRRRPLDRRHLKVLVRIGAAVMLLTGLFLAGTAIADDIDPRIYQPDGIGSLFQTPQLGAGLSPTLFEKHGDGAWSFDWSSQGFTHVAGNTVGPILNAISNVAFSITKALARAAIGLSWQLSTFDAFTSLSGSVSEAVGSIAGILVPWLLPSTMAIGALVAFGKSQSGQAGVLNQLLAVAFAGIAALSMAMQPAAWTDSVNMIRSVGATASGALTSAVSTDLQTPFPGPQATFGDDPSQNAQRRMADAIWRTYVATPWCLAEFGNMPACERFAEEVLSRTSEERTQYIDGDLQKVVGRDSDSYLYIAGQNGATRLGTVLPSILTGIIFCGLVIFLKASVVIYLMLALLLLIVGAFFLCMAAIPGQTRTWGTTWAYRLLTFTLMSFLADLVVTATIAISMLTMRLTGSLGSGVSQILTITAVLASLMLFRQLRDITGTASSGFGRIFGTGAGLAMAASRFLPRRTKKPRELNRSPRDGGKTEYGSNTFEPAAPQRPQSPSGPRRPGPAGPAITTRNRRALTPPPQRRLGPGGRPGLPPAPQNPPGPQNPHGPQDPGDPGIVNGEASVGRVTYHRRHGRFVPAGANTPRRRYTRPATPPPEPTTTGTQNPPQTPPSRSTSQRSRGQVPPSNERNRHGEQ